jgi:hypothetical protein
MGFEAVRVGNLGREDKALEVGLCLLYLRSQISLGDNRANHNCISWKRALPITRKPGITNLAMRPFFGIDPRKPAIRIAEILLYQAETLGGWAATQLQ